MLFGGLEEIQKKHINCFTLKRLLAYCNNNSAKITENKRENFTFGCFNHSRKLTMDAIKLFCKVLEECSGSTLALKSISFNEDEEIKRIIEKIEEHGIEKSRIKIFKAADTKIKHLERYNEIDVALDPIPYGGATTSCEALSMGVPVITLAGKEWWVD